MHEHGTPESVDLKALWRDQSVAKQPAPSPEDLMFRARRLRAKARSETHAAVSAVLFFAAVFVWRVGPSDVSIASVAAMTAWVAITLLWLRRRSRSDGNEAFAASGLEFYRRELEQRRVHLRSTWVWHGPLLLACIALAGVAVGTGTLAYRGLAQVSPLIVALGVWIVITIRQRLREANAIQRELDELGEDRSHGRD